MSGSNPWHFWTVWQHCRLSELRCTVPSLWSELPPDTSRNINSMAQLQAGCCGTSLRWCSLGETAYSRPIFKASHFHQTLFFILNLTPPCSVEVWGFLIQTRLFRNSSVSLKCTTDPLVSQQSAYGNQVFKVCLIGKVVSPSKHLLTLSTLWGI